MASSFDSMVTTLKGWLPLKNPPSYTLGLQFFRKKAWKTAQQHFQKAVRERPKHAASHFKLGMCYFHQFDYTKASRSISKAVALAPEQVQWQEQQQQVKNKLNKINKPKNSENKVIDNASEPQALVTVIQLAALNAEYQKVVDLSRWVEELLGASKAHHNSLKKIRHFACESALMSGDLNVFEESLLRLDEQDSARYRYSAIANYYRGNLQKAIDEFQLLITVSNSPDVIYWYSKVLVANGDKQLAWQLLENVARKSRRAATWQHLADLVDTPHQLQQYLMLLDEWCAKSSTARHHRDVAVATSKAAIAGGNGALARKVLHDSIEYHQKRQGGPSSVLPDDVKNVQDAGTPTWVTPFASVPYIALKSSRSARAKECLQSLMAVASKTASTPIALQYTLQWMLNDLRSNAPATLLFGVEATESLESFFDSLVNQTFFIQQHREKNRLELSHANGLSVTIVVFESEGGVKKYHEHGATYTHAVLEASVFETQDLKCYVPKEIGIYFSESGIDQNRLTEEWLLISENKINVDEDVYTAHAYKVWLYALINQSSELEGQAVRALRKSNEHKQPYQRQLQSYTIPDAATIRRDQVQVVIYVSGIEKVGYQANMWIPVLERLSVPAAIVIREKRIASELDETELPVYFIKEMRHLEVLEEGGVKTILYPGNPQKATQSLRLHRLNHYFINHGESDKVVNQSKFLMAYDKLLVAGPLAERRLKEANLPLRDNQIVHVGRPQVELLLDQAAEPNKTIKTILYAPTWEGFVEEANYASISEFGLTMLKQLAQRNDVEVLFKPHPYTGYNKNGNAGYYLKQMLALCSVSENIHYIDTSDGIHKYMNQSDLLITDVSSVLNEYLYTLKPIILCNVQGQNPEVLAVEYPSTRATYVLEDGALIDSLFDTVRDFDNKVNDRKFVYADSLGSFPEGYMSRFNSIVVGGELI
ncbi:CDP-glycerol glycerophosphotransferase family protein [Vreelandella profundi]|uniref:CDP-glycerol glycerophosphotransferase family protein n=1 Tax=Vreelandella profundi TaxID=2852117 RepID=UPI001F02514B|nr:CDP-glycerol glycerophosphotransferase family protein [Halomonas profundi]